MSNETDHDLCPPIDCYNLSAVDLEPYPDISGNGVLIGFVGTAYLVLLLVIANYFLAFDPDQDPFVHATTAGRLPNNSDDCVWRSNPVDYRLLKWMRAKRVIFSSPILRARLQEAFNESIIALCDIQVVTGLSILISGYVLLRCGLQAYHWQIAVYLAWFSTVTHLSGLTVLRAHLRTHPWAKYCRFGLMCSLLVLLVVGVVPTGFFNGGNFSAQATCYFSPAYGYWRFAEEGGADEVRVEDTSEWQAMVLSVVLLIVGFVTRSVKLFQPLSATFSRKVRRPLSYWAQKMLSRFASRRVSSVRGEKLRIKLLLKPALAAFFMVRLSCDLFSSMLLEIYWLFAISLWGTVKLLAARNIVSGERGGIVASAESQWTFGQILPVILLVGPIFTTVGIFAFHVTKGELSRPVSPSNTTTQQLIRLGPIYAACSGPHSSRDVVHDPSEAILVENSETDNATNAVARPQVLADSHGELGSYLIDSRDAPWLSVCVAVPIFCIVAGTIIAFAAIFNFTVGFEAQWSLYELWISEFQLIYPLCVGYPCACATAIRFGLGMDLRGWWRRFFYFWLCVFTYAFVGMTPLLFTLLSPPDRGFLAAPYAGAVITVMLYALHAIVAFTIV